MHSVKKSFFIKLDDDNFHNAAKRHPLLRAVIKKDDDRIWFEFRDEMNVEIEDADHKSIKAPW